MTGLLRPLAACLISASVLAPAIAAAEDESPPLSIYGFARLDVLLNASYNKDLGKLFNNPNDPTLATPQRETSSIAGGVRGDFTMSRNMTSGMELGYTRSRDEKNNQTVTTIRLGVNLTFLF